MPPVEMRTHDEPAAMTTDDPGMRIGERVRLAECVENGSEIFVDSGETGTIDQMDDESIWVKLDRHFPALDEWDNCLQIWHEWHPNALERHLDQAETRN